MRASTGSFCKVTGFVLALILLGLAPARAGETPLRLGTNVWPGYEPFYLAKTLYDWDPRTDIRLVEFPSASEVLRAFANGAIEAAAVTLDEALVLKEHGDDLRIVLVTDVSAGADVIMARPEISDMARLKGRRIAVETGALGAYMLSRALDLHGLDLGDITVVHLDVSSHEQAYTGGEIDAAVTFEPFRTRFLKAGARQIFDSSAMPGEIVDVVIVHAAALPEFEPQLRRLTDGWFGALEHIETDRAAAAEIMAEQLGIAPDEVIESYRGLELGDRALNERFLTGAQPELRATLARLQDTMLAHELLRRAVDIDPLIDGRLLND